MMQKRILRVLGFLRVRGVLGIWVALAAQAGVAGAAETPNYPRAAEPIVKPALVALPPGAVEPAGWLRDWALAARDGITGHLDERHATFRDGWKGVRINSTGAYGAEAMTDPTGPATGLLPRAPRRGLGPRRQVLPFGVSLRLRARRQVRRREFSCCPSHSGQVTKERKVY